MNPREQFEIISLGHTIKRWHRHGRDTRRVIVVFLQSALTAAKNSPAESLLSRTYEQVSEESSAEFAEAIVGLMNQYCLRKYYSSNIVINQTRD